MATLGVYVIAAQLGADRGARLFGREQLFQLIERYAKQVLQAHDLLQALNLGIGCRRGARRTACWGPGSRPISS